MKLLRFPKLISGRRPRAPIAQQHARGSEKNEAELTQSNKRVKPLLTNASFRHQKPGLIRCVTTINPHILTFLGPETHRRVSTFNTKGQVLGKRYMW